MPLNSYVGVLTPRTSECDRVWRSGLYRGNPDEFVRWGLTPIWPCPYKKGKFGRRYGHA